MSPVLLFPFLLLLLMLSYKYTLSNHRRRHGNVPPSPFKLPIIGNLHQLGSLPHRSLHSLAQKHNSSIMLLYMGQVPTIIVSSADAAREVLKTQDLSFASRPISKATAALTYGPRNVSFSPYGDHWRHAKKAAIVHLLSPKRVQSFRRLRYAAVSKLVKTITEHVGEVVNLTELLHTYSNSVVSEAAAGRVAREEGREAKFVIQEEGEGMLLDGFQVFDMFPSIGWLSKVLGLDAKLQAVARRRDELLSKVVEEHKRQRATATAEGGEEDFVDVLLSLAEGGDGEFVPTENEIKAITVDMIAAGTDTSYEVLDWAMAELVRNSTALKKAQEEVRKVCNGKSNIHEDNLDRMQFLKAIAKETLRLHPPAPLLLPRETIQNTTLQGYEIVAKTRVIINAWAIGRDPNSWSDAEEFRPERFLDNNIDYRGLDFQFIPFGAGRRMCPGINFAIISIELALANLLHHFNWTLPGGLRPGDLDMIEGQGLTTPRKSQLYIIPTPHVSS